MRFCVVNLGCKVNRVESDFYEKTLLEQGFSFVGADADLVVVNTCTVTGEAEKKTRKAVRQTLKKHPRALVLVTGCAAAINPDVFEEMSERVRVVSKTDSFSEVLRVSRERHDEARSGGEEVSETYYEGNVESNVGMSDSSTQPRARTRVGVKVQDGCDNACTYCIVHVARGKARSRSLESILPEVVSLAENGVREIVLSGINIGSYCDGGVRLAQLLKSLLQVTESVHAPGQPPVRFRVSSIEPIDVSDDFVHLLAESDGRICRHLHLPLQSGSSKVLREMARPYDAEDFKQLVDFIRAEVPEISLSTDIIVGFPGETEGDFQDTLEMARYCGFSKIHVFPYSKREGTPAAERADQVAAEVKTARAARLRALSDELRAADYAKRAGTSEYVLIEQQGRAMTESYYEIYVPESLTHGDLVSLTLPESPCVDNVLPE